MADWGTSRFVKWAGRAALGVDAWVNSSLYESGRRSREAYENFSAFMDRFHTAGLARAGVELACEGLTLGLAGSILALALAIPAFRETSDDWLKKQELAVTFLDRYGVEVGRRGIRHDDSVPLDQLPDHFIKAVLATEDRRFYEHFGIDFIGTMRALSVNARSSSVVQGGSSITQQLAKNLFLTNERTVERKVKEAFLALWLEAHLSKQDILKLYLDRAYMGGGTFGAQAAANFYFGKSIRDINLGESAMLAGLFKAPTKYAPHINLPAARARANDVLSNLIDSGFMTEGQVYAARKNPATPVDRRRETSPDWYLDWAFDEVRKLADARKLGDDRVLTVRTALDVNLQKHAETVIEDQLRQNGAAYHVKQGATVILEPNGAVRAIVGGRDYGDSQFNRATDAQRQPGSSFKPFVYATALMTGRFTPDTPISGGGYCWGNWCPHNYGGASYGSMPMWLALTKSVNTAAARLSEMIGKGNQKIGRTMVVDTARRMGITTALPDTPSLVIGADDVTVIDMASAYAAFANGGRRAPPFAALEVRSSSGATIYRRELDVEKFERVLPEKVAVEMVCMMTHVVEEGTAKAAHIDGIHIAGKTGTTNGSKDAWFVGYSGNYVEAVWFGNDDNASTNNMTGGSVPARTWREIMAYAHQGIELKGLPGLPAASPLLAAVPAPANGKVSELGAPQRPATLSRVSADVIGSIEEKMRSAEVKRAALTKPVAFASGARPRVETMTAD